MARTALATGVAAAVLATASPAAAVSFTLQGANDATLKASINFTYTAGTNGNGTIKVEVTNTSTAYNPSLTGFAFNVPGSVYSLKSFSNTPQNGSAAWSGLFDPNAIESPQPFGAFDMGAVTGPSLNGGKPNDGVQVGSTRTFYFGIKNNSSTPLTEQSFLSLFSNPKNQSDGKAYFVARFQRTGANGNGSDVAVPGGSTPGGGGGGGGNVPEPASMLLFGLAASGAALRFRRARR